MEVSLYIGKMGAGKTTQMFIDASTVKAKVGVPIIMLSFAEELKSIIKSKFCLTKYSILTPSTECPKQFTNEEVSNTLKGTFITLATSLLGQSYGIKAFQIIDNMDLSILTQAINNCHNNINYNKSFRYIIQTIGTEIGRAISPNLWVLALNNKIYAIKEITPDAHIFIDDCRFIEELRYTLTYCANANIKTNITIMNTSDELRYKRLGFDESQIQKIANHPSEKQVDTLTAFIKADYNKEFTGHYKEILTNVYLTKR